MVNLGGGRFLMSEVPLYVPRAIWVVERSLVQANLRESFLERDAVSAIY